MPGDVFAAGLLEPGAREQHLLGTCELHRGAPAQLCLFSRGGDELGRPVLSQRFGDAQVVGIGGG